MASDQLSAVLNALLSRRRMPPWQEIGYFNDPNTIVNSMSGSEEWQMIAPANPNRVALLLGVSEQASAVVGVDPTIPNNAGFYMSTAVLPLVITERDHGNLCCVAWYARALTTTVVTAIEVILREWP